SDYKVAQAVRRDGGRGLIAGRSRVDAEFAPQGQAEVRVTLGIDAGTAAVLPDARPRDHEIAQSVDRHCGIKLVAGDCGVDSEFASDWRARSIESPGVNSPAATVLVLAGPDDHRLAGWRHSDGPVAGLLHIGRRSVDNRFRPELERL